MVWRGNTEHILASRHSPVVAHVPDTALLAVVGHIRCERRRWEAPCILDGLRSAIHFFGGRRMGNW